MTRQAGKLFAAAAIKPIHVSKGAISGHISIGLNGLGAVVDEAHPAILALMPVRKAYQ
jgi:hypothetical protein